MSFENLSRPFARPLASAKNDDDDNGDGTAAAATGDYDPPRKDNNH